MIIERDSNRKEREQLYRKQLLSDINERKVIKNQSRIQDEQPKQTFSLIKNIEVEQQRRKNKNREYYAELQQQRQDEIRRKKEEKMLKEKRQLEEQKKLQMQNEQLRKKYEEEKRRENQKKNIPQPEIANFAPKKQQPKLQVNPIFKDQIDYIKDHQQQILKQEEHFPQQNEKLEFNHQVYPSRVENQEFNFIPRKKFPDNYYKELLYEGRKFQQSINMISDMNKVLNRERHRPKKTMGRGLQDLRQLDKMLQEQSKTYMSSAYSEKLSYYSNVGKRSKTQQYSATNYEYYDKY